MKSIKQLKEIYHGKKVLITGHTGFKGSWLSIILDYLGAEVFGVSIDSNTNKGVYSACDMKKKLLVDKRIDICDKDKLKEFINSIQPIYFHLTHNIRSISYKYPAETIITNAIGPLIY